MLSIEQKVGQKFCVGFYGLEAPDYLLQWLSEGRVGGVILFGRNIQNPQQLADLTRTFHEAASSPILIGIDQEGGMIARLRDQDGFTESPGAMAIGASGSEQVAYDVCKVLAKELRLLGINWTYAPVVDLPQDINNRSVSTRALGIDPQLVNRLATAEMRGFQSEGVAATVKHFPGLGNTAVDTHEALAVIEESLDYLREYDLVPFKNVVEAGVATVMTTHVKFPAVDPEYPSTLSPVIIGEILRGEFGYGGVVATDCMEMKAITDHYGPGESAVLAALAGVDLLLFSHERELQETAIGAVVAAVKSGRILMDALDESVARIQQLKRDYPAQLPTDISEVHSPSHLEVMNNTARQTLTLIQKDENVFPLDVNSDEIGLIEFASFMDTGIIEKGDLTRFAGVFEKAFPQSSIVSLQAFDAASNPVQRALQIAAEKSFIVLATRNAHLYPEELDIARQVVQQAENVILLCLRNPYDVDVLPGASTVLCTCGDGMPSLIAAVDALRGEFEPSGRLSVPLQNMAL